MWQKIMPVNPDDTIIMDHNPIPFSYHSNQMLEKKETETFHVKALTADDKHAMLAATIMTSSKLLKPD
jgi:hypothetical protein